MSKKIYKLLTLILLVYSGSMTYMAVKGIRPGELINSYLGGASTYSKPNVEAEYKFISILVEDYFLIDTEFSLINKYNDLKNKVYSGLSSNFLVEFKNTLKLYTENNATRTYDLKKVLRKKNETFGYRVFLETESLFPEEGMRKFLIQIDLNLTRSNSHEKTYKLKSWTEKVLANTPKELSSTDILIDSLGQTEIRLPCNFEFLAPLNNHDSIGVSLESRNKLIKFSQKNELEGNAQFKASCKNRVFDLNLENDETYQTVFHSFKLSDGVPKLKKLTEREKLIRTLEKHMNVKVMR